MAKNDITEFQTLPPSEFAVDDTGVHARLFRHGDEEALLQIASDGAVQAFVPWAKRIHDLEGAEKAIDEFESAWDTRRLARYALEKDGQVIGYSGLWPDKEEGYYEFGFAVVPDFRGRGIGKRVVRRLLEIAQSELDAKGMVAYVDDRNVASKSVVLSSEFVATDEFDDGDRRYTLNFN